MLSVDETGGDARDPRLQVHLRPGPGEERQRSFAVEPDADLGQDALRRLVDARLLSLVQEPGLVPHRSPHPIAGRRRRRTRPPLQPRQLRRHLVRERDRLVARDGRQRHLVGLVQDVRPAGGLEPVEGAVPAQAGQEELAAADGVAGLGVGVT